MSQAAYARGRPKPNDKWHLDEVVIVINGANHWPSRAVDANTKAARRFFKKLIALWQAKCCGHRQARQLHQANPEPCSTGRSQADQRAHKGLNTRIEGSHRPTRKREKIMGHSKSLRQV